MKNIMLLSSLVFLLNQVSVSAMKELVQASRPSSSFFAVSSGWDDEEIKEQLPDLNLESESFLPVTPPVFVPTLEEQRKAFMAAFSKQRTELLQACNNGLAYERIRKNTVLMSNGQTTSSVFEGVAIHTTSCGLSFAFLGATAGLLCAAFAAPAALLIGGGAALGGGFGIVGGNLELYDNTLLYREKVRDRIKTFAQIKRDVEKLTGYVLNPDDSRLSEPANIEENMTELERQLVALNRTQAIIGFKKNKDREKRLYFIS